ncbi:MAG: hypothetical protein AB8F95_15310 [Bacteroidia bacterium]
MAERKHPSTVNILIKHLHDHDTIGTFQGCIISRQLVGDFFLEIVTPNYVSNEAYKLNGKEKSTIDSVLLFDKKVQLEARNALLKAIEPLDKYYERLKEIYNKEDNPAALIAISKYKKETDIPLIKTWLSKTQTRDQYYGLRAVIHFPHAEFFPYLKHIHEQEIAKPSGFSYSLNRVLYLAIVQYQNRESRELIEYTLDKATGPALKYHYEAIWLALTKYPNSIYTGLKRNIILTESQKESLRRWLDRPD